MFSYDVFLSYSSKDRIVVHDIAERLKKDGLRVWLDAWEIRPGDSIPSRLEQGLENSRVLVLCMSANAFGSDWSQLESGTFRFRDPLNKDRRFIPLRLDESPIKGSLSQFLYINWLPAAREEEYSKLLDACRPVAMSTEVEGQGAIVQVAEKTIRLNTGTRINAYAFSPDGKRVLASGVDKTVRLWDIETGSCLHVLEGHTDSVDAVAWSTDRVHALSASADGTMRLWHVESGRSLRVFECHIPGVRALVWSSDGRRALSGGEDDEVRLWDVETGGVPAHSQGRRMGLHLESCVELRWSAGRFGRL
jgi:hypothetical protein